MTWKVIFKDEALQQLRKLNPTIQNRITNYLKMRLATDENPRRFGKGLTVDMKGLWRYRVDDYRIICLIEDEALTVLVLKIGHRRKVYK
ncbi:MAG: type II toxin-antitoxin system RelE/ParE family toxin [Crocosphaera sp.]|nr:type II toxin-antitoxin system RelE/ParE family toxin [Crocosphaera sp.]